MRRLLELPVGCRRARLYVLLGVLGGLAVAFSAPAAWAATPVPMWPAATELPLAADVNPTPMYQLANLDSVTCASAGNCVAVGSYKDNNGNNDRRAMLATESSGVWSAPTMVMLPGDAALTGQTATLLGVSCTSPGNCVAGGYYKSTGATFVAMVITETNGAWGQASALTLPLGTTSSDSEVYSVACPSAGSCVAVGYYLNTHGDYLSTYATETGGAWGQEVPLTLPGDANPNGTGIQDGTLNSVTCTSPGNCVAAGSYQAGANYQAMLATETSGVWAPATVAGLPTGADPSAQDAGLLAVTCTSAGNCVAAGYYKAGGLYESMVLTETSGAWGQAGEIALPSGASTVSPQDSDLESVTCSAPGNCVGVGRYDDTNGSGNSQAMVVTETGGVWGQAVKVVLPSGATTAAGGQTANLYSVTCTSQGSCVAVGGYSGPAGDRQAMTLTSVPSLAVSTTGLPAAVAGVPYSATLAATGGAVKYAWSLSSGVLPAGLTLTPSTGLIYGTPTATASGSSSFTAAVSDSGPPGQEASAALSIAVSVPAPASASFGAVTIKGSKVMITVTCSGTALQTCTGNLLLTTLEHLTGHKITAISAAKKAKKPKKSKRTITVGKGSYSVTGGRGLTVTMSLNGTGKALLAKFHKLPAKLALTPTGAKKPTASKTITIKAPKTKTKRKHHH